jgi:hypothetical protein
MFENFVRQLRDDMSMAPERTNAAGWLFGTVTAADPLAVLLESGLELPAAALVLSPFASEWKNACAENANTDGDGYFDFRHSHKIKAHDSETTAIDDISVTTSGGSGTGVETGGHKHTIPEMTTEESLLKIRMWRGLRKGDKVLLSRVQGGQMFVVWFRVTLVSNGRDYSSEAS